MNDELPDDYHWEEQAGGWVIVFGDIVVAGPRRTKEAVLKEFHLWKAS